MNKKPIAIDLTIIDQTSNYSGFIPSEEQLTSWVAQAIKAQHPNAEIGICLLDKASIQGYNQTYRQLHKPTNVLAFPTTEVELQNCHLLGDILACPEIINQEAIEQQLTEIAHWTHIIVHACLHLLGFDHISDSDAKTMEAEEIQILKQLGVANPYER